MAMCFCITRGTFDADPVELARNRPATLPIDTITLEQAVSTYLFQLPTVDDRRRLYGSARADSGRAGWKPFPPEVQRILADSTNPINAVHYMDLRESMQERCWPACRLRVRRPTTNKRPLAVTSSTRHSTNSRRGLNATIRTSCVPTIWLTPTWSMNHKWRSMVTSILGLGSIYDFQ
ncbi:MAG: N-succinylarginine dihydrolase [Acidimicrobiales bacterium]